jgi:hypothetical protein
VNLRASIKRTYEVHDQSSFFEKVLPEIQKDKASFFIGNKYIVSVHGESFKIRNQKDRIIIEGRYFTRENNISLTVHYRPYFNPSWIFYPIAFFLLSILFTPGFELNGADASIWQRLGLAAGGTAVTYWLTIVLTHHKVDLERLAFERKIASVMR